MQDKKNTLYYGDNYFILREHIPSESVDLIYLDPPFNSNRTYNVLFKDEHGTDSEAQIKAFEDSWHWNLEAEQAYAEILTEAPDNVAKLIDSLRDFIGTNQVMAYLVMMTTRLVELHRVLKPTGSLYLHCDPTASHYLKIILDVIFGVNNFRNEISWERSQTRSSISKSFRKAHDILLFYSKSENYTFNMQFKELSEASMKLYRSKDEKGFYQAVPVLVSGSRNGETGTAWKGINPTMRGNSGMHWVTKPSKLDEYENQGLILWPKKDGGIPRLKYYLSDSPGVPLNDIWHDITLISSSSHESLGYPTQKPLSLLERIIKISSNPGDIVLDPFCGCGTAVVAAEHLKRNWIGIDITHLGITAMKFRLKDSYPGISFKVIGEPTDIGAARQLALEDRYQFQWWALSLIPGAMPLGRQEGSREGKKGSDKGIDGVLTFIDDSSSKAKRALIQVKSGHVSSSMIRDLIGTVQRENATMGVFVTLENPTKDMVTEALSAGFYKSPGWNKQYPMIQIYTIDELLHKAEVNMPPRYWWGKKAKVLKSFGEQKVLGLMPRVKRSNRQQI
jgi:site-specific DNA-methyltransferase (adenine-specific)